MARLFDLVDPVSGPGFHSDHPKVTDAEERDRLLTYLTSGQMVVGTTSQMTDPLDPAAGEVVPLNFLTDGTWVWTEGVSYFLSRHQLEPDAELVAHIRRRDFEPQSTDRDTLSRICNFVLAPRENRN